MNTIELESKKADLARKILNMDNETLLNELSSIIENFNLRFPCQHTIEELKTGISTFLKDIESGKTISHETIKRK